MARQQAQTPITSDLITYQQAAELLGVTYSAVAQAVGNQRLHPTRIPGSKFKYLHRGEVMAYRDRDRSAAINPTTTPVESPMLSADALSALVDSLGASTGQEIRNAGRDVINGIITARVALLQVATGGQVTADPKLLATFMRP